MNSLTQVLDDGATLVDVREPFEVLLGGIDKAINIPLSEIDRRLDELKSINGPIVLFCRSGNRSARALLYLQQQGMDQAYNGGGINDIKALLQTVC